MIRLLIELALHATAAPRWCRQQGPPAIAQPAGITGWLPVSTAPKWTV